MEPKPKERIVFDEDSYYGDEGAEWAVNDLMERKGLTEDEVRESFTDDEVFQHAMKLRDFDYEEEMRALTAFFDGKKSDMSDFINPYGGNHIFVAGSVERWDDTIPVIQEKLQGGLRHPARCGRWRLFPFGGSERSRPIALRSPGEQESRPQYDSETE